ncbi:MAG TPA: M67 family metallopeptidase [Chloroflexota bacterium]|nr:M67 family metallopeptidase [Chloroflexota bacterium]
MLTLGPALVQEMFAHATSELPNEACGILAGENGQAIRFFPAANAEHSPTRYVVDPQDQLRILNELYTSGWDLLGIFHSHTHTQAYPSSTDVSLAANWPEAYYLIASLQNEPPTLRAFRVLDGQVTEEEISRSESA